ncbi:hypothetical protein [Glaciecola sp. SC05]|uniref:hypothetical protein n=1 Tax=Glaciecola sp. SC05 TaxID=1987355 RepID=UPI00352966FC
MSIARQQIASLHAMGIDIYQQYRKHGEKPAIVNKAWFGGLLDLLNINEDNCQFSDALPISFDPVTKTLVLPLTITSDDASIKQQIWQKIKGDVEL